MGICHHSILHTSLGIDCIHRTKTNRLIRLIRTKGFTLVELLIVVGIIGILLAVTSTAYTLAQRRSRDTRRITDMKAIQSAFEQYASDHNGAYPNATSDVTATYLPAGIPSDPKTKVAYTGISFNAPGYEYCACAALETTNGGNASNAQCSFIINSAYFCVRNVQ